MRYASSRIGKKSKMETTLISPPEPEMTPVHAEHSLSPSSVKVLLVEDDPADALLFQRMVRKAGADFFEIEEASTLEEAVRRLKAGGFGLVLCDLSLPDSEGLETFTKLHAN